MAMIQHKEYPMTKYSRRRFLGGSLAAAAAVSLGPYVSRAQSPNDNWAWQSWELEVVAETT